jgi:23S rRNA (cytosine1962-C5)-methyltransferase
MRLVASESDNLPGVIVDRYANVLVFQLLSAGAEKHRDKIVWALQKHLPDCQLFERSDPEVRNKEGLETVVKAYAENMPEFADIEENGFNFHVDYQSGHKTGFYLDQRENRQLIASFVKDKTVLNCFSYTGAIGVYCLHAGATQVTQVDKSAEALSLATRHLEENGCDPEKSELVQADVFALLREYRQQERRFDAIILDPPKFVDSRQHLNKACRGYKDINWLAMQLLNPGGTLVTFSCSGLMPEDLFRKVVADAALDAGREVKYLKRLSQAADHPVASAFPEGMYLKGLICHVT